MAIGTIASAASSAAAIKLAQKLAEELAKYATGKATLAIKEMSNKKVLRNIASNLIAIDKVKTLVHSEKEVSLSSIYYPSRIAYDGGRSVKIECISELPSSGNYIIQGTIGQGKSFFLRYLCLSQLKDSGNAFPIFLELKTLAENDDLLHFIQEGFRDFGLQIDNDLFELYARSGRFVLLLDAFDELPEAAITDVVKTLEQLTRRYPALRIFVTSRPDSALHPSAAFRILKLERLQTTDHEPFLAKLTQDSEHAKKMKKAIRSSPRIEQLLSTPLLLTLLTRYYNSDLSVPNNEAEFYQRLFEVLLYRHDLSKAGYKRQRHTKLGEREIRELFEAFCFATRREGKGQLTKGDFYRALEAAKASTKIAVDSDLFMKDVVKVACLMQEEGNTIQFIHKSVQEFYAAAFILHSAERVAEKFLGSMVTTGRWQKWRQEIHFLSIVEPYRYCRFFLQPSLVQFMSEAGVSRSPNGSFTASTLTTEICLKRYEIHFKIEADKTALDRFPDDWSPAHALTQRLIANASPTANYVYDRLSNAVLPTVFDCFGEYATTDAKQVIFKLLQSSDAKIEDDERSLSLEVTDIQIPEFRAAIATVIDKALKEFSKEWQWCEQEIAIQDERIASMEDL